MGKEIAKSIKYILSSILDIIYPAEEKCIICEEDYFIGLCPYCKSSIKRVIIQDEILSYGYYGGILKELILSFKYYKNFNAGNVLAEFLVEIYSEQNIMADVICYVPTSKSSKKLRGFNQCEFLAKKISEKLNIPISNCIKKVKENKEQKTLSKEERNTNVEGVFNVYSIKDIVNKTVILVDDVVTTGATLRECMKVLRNYNVKTIIVLTIAKSNI